MTLAGSWGQDGCQCILKSGHEEREVYVEAISRHCVYSVLGVIEVATSCFHVADRGHTHSNGMSVVPFHISHRASSLKTTAACVNGANSISLNLCVPESSPRAASAPVAMQQSTTTHKAAFPGAKVLARIIRVWKLMSRMWLRVLAGDPQRFQRWYRTATHQPIHQVLSHCR